MTVVVKTAPDRDLYVELAAGQVINAGDRDYIAGVLADRWARTHPGQQSPDGAVDDLIGRIDHDGATDPTHGWTAATIPVGDVSLPRPQLAAYVGTYLTGDHPQRRTILRNAGRVTHTSSQDAA